MSEHIASLTMVAGGVRGLQGDHIQLGGQCGITLMDAYLHSILTEN